jgi:hypothetical protein
MVDFERLTWPLLVVAAFLLGLGVPKAFSLLYVLVLGLGWLAWRRRVLLWPPMLRCPTVLLLLFGVSHVSLQIAHQVWHLGIKNLPEILAIGILPSACLLAGWWLWGLGLGHWRLSLLLLLYACGALLYALLSVALSRDPWWNLAQPLTFLAHVPWGETRELNIRSIEQRAFPAVVLVTLMPPLLLSGLPRRKWLGLLLGLIVGAALLVVSAFQSRLAILSIGLAAMPLVIIWWKSRWRLWVLVASSVALIGLASSAQLCDERPSRYGAFLMHLWQAPWGGRLIHFSYPLCSGSVVQMRAGDLVHNVFLDVFNDTGFLPTLLLFAAVLPLASCVLRGLILQLSRFGWSWHLAVRWSFASVLLVEWMFQPLIFSDQLMFTLGFVLIGMVLAESGICEPQDFCVVLPSRPV